MLRGYRRWNDGGRREQSAGDVAQPPVLAAPEQDEVAPVYVSQTHQGPHVPGWLLPLLLGLLAVLGTILVWAAFAARPLSTDSRVQLPLPVDAGRVRSVAYSVPGPEGDSVYIRSAGADAAPRLLMTFPSVLGLHARGTASPSADTLAILSVSNYPGTFARMTLLNTVDFKSRLVEAEFEYLSALTWKHDGSSVAGVRYSSPDDAGRVTATLVEVDARTGTPAVIARFDNVLEAAPVGYSLDGARLYVAVIDQSGSTLSAVRSGRAQKVGALSAGRTRDWALSPDGARLAYVDIRPDGERTYVGRTMLIATGAVTETPAKGDQIGAAWPPGSEVADFGGPGGTVQLTQASEEPEYVIPVRWSPDGSMLVARVTAPPGGAGASRLAETIELTSTASRVLLADVPGAWVFGFVFNVE